MRGHKICFNGEMWIIIPKLSMLPLLIWSTGNLHFIEDQSDHNLFFLAISQYQSIAAISLMQISIISNLRLVVTIVQTNGTEYEQICTDKQ